MKEQFYQRWPFALEFRQAWDYIAQLNQRRRRARPHYRADFDLPITAITCDLGDSGDT